MIVATVGHVDHGKTELVKALTGVDTDRLPEEKARGMSIELGFAYRQTPSGRVIGFVDVPGHERFVRTMLCGVAGIHHALIVVAVDDGPMPQTIEHLELLDLLELRAASVIITKVDRVAASRVAAVAAEMQALLSRHAMPEAPVFPVCAPRGEGLEALSRHLDALAEAWSTPAPRGHFRLALDRCFTLSGAGLIVTGTVFAGSVAPGDSVTVCPSGARARVRSVHAQGRPAERGSSGERCALNLAGIELDPKLIRRGDWIVAEALCTPTSRIGARLRVVPGSPAPRSGTRVHLHLAAKETTGRLRFLRERGTEPGGEALAEVLLDEPIGALWGDRFVLRDWAARRIIGGGRVLDPFAPPRGPVSLARFAVLESLANTDPSEALRALIAAEPNGVSLACFALARNLTAEESERVFAGIDMVRIGPESDPLAITTERWEALRDRIVGALDCWHRENPESWGPGEAELRKRLALQSQGDVYAACLRALAEEGKLARRGVRLHRPGHRPALSAERLALWQKIAPLLAAGGTRPPSVGHLAAALGMTPAAVAAFLAQAAELGFVLPIAANRFYPLEALATLARAARDLAAEREDGLFSAAEFRDRTGIGRNVTIKVLEYFDRCGLTQRAGDRRGVVRSPEEVLGRAAG